MSSAIDTRNPSEDPRFEKVMHSFSLALSGITEVTDALETALYDAGCTDALLCKVEGVVYLDFDREATTLDSAIRSAIADVERTGLGIKVSGVRAIGENAIKAANASLNLKGTSLWSKLCTFFRRTVLRNPEHA